MKADELRVVVAGAIIALFVIGSLAIGYVIADGANRMVRENCGFNMPKKTYFGMLLIWPYALYEKNDFELGIEQHTSTVCAMMKE